MIHIHIDDNDKISRLWSTTDRNSNQTKTQQRTSHLDSYDQQIQKNKLSEWGQQEEQIEGPS